MILFWLRSLIHIAVKQKLPKKMPIPKDGVYALEDWSNRWREGRAGWHLGDVHKMLAKHFDKVVDGRTDVKIFVPLCGKAKDLKWMFDQGKRIIGLE